MESIRKLTKSSAALWLGLVLVFSGGIFLRTLWPEDMEYKSDEKAFFDNSQNWIEGKPWPLVGMNSSTGIPNPGLIYWSYIILAKATNAKTPLALNRSIRWLNIFVLLGFFIFIYMKFKKSEREQHLWAFAIMCVNPFQVLWDRKIWSAIPIISLACLVGWWGLSKKSGAFLWGVMGALLGQVHMTGFFFSFALVAWTFCFERKSNIPRTKWMYWIAGSISGTLLLIPWLIQVIATERSSGNSPIWEEVFRFRFFRYWFAIPLGMRLTYTLGQDHFTEFMQYPILTTGTATQLVQISHWLNTSLGILVFGAGIFAMMKKIWNGQSIFPEANDQTSHLLLGALLGYGFVLSVGTIDSLIYHHYLCVCTFLAFLFLTRAALKLPSIHWGRTALTLLVISEFLISFSFLQYIHMKDGTTNPDSQYKRTLRWQQESPNNN